MTNRMDNLQVVFDRTDWNELRKQKRVLQRLNAVRDLDCIHELMNWLDALEAAAEMDGYQVKQKEPTQ